MSVQLYQKRRGGNKNVAEKDLPVILLHNLDFSWGAHDLKSAVREVDFLENEIIKQGYAIKNSPLFDRNIHSLLSDLDPMEHIVLNWCENIPGIPKSEAAVIRTLEEMRFTYTGSEAEIVERSWNKPQIKRILDANCVPTPKWQVFETDDCSMWNCFPAIVKPALEHCSYGVTTDSVVSDNKEMKTRIQYILDNFKGPALIEDFIDGREFHVSVWGNGKIEMLPPAEMDFAACSDFHERLCTYDSKFEPDSAIFKKINVVVPAKLSQNELRIIESVTSDAYRLSGCRDYARLDVRLRDGCFYVLDINPNPDIGFETSMAYAAQSIGYSYGAMIGRLIHFACLRHPNPTSAVKKNKK